MLIANHLFMDGYNVLNNFFNKDYGPSILQMGQVPGIATEINFIQSLLPFWEIFFDKTKEVTDEIYRQQFGHYFKLAISENTPYELYWRAVSLNREDNHYKAWIGVPVSVKKRRVGGKKKTKKKKNKKKKKKTKKTKKKYYKRNTFKKKKMKRRKQK